MRGVIYDYEEGPKGSPSLAMEEIPTDFRHYPLIVFERQGMRIHVFGAGIENSKGELAALLLMYIIGVR